MIERDILYLGCQRKHTWESAGGANAGCGLDCVCSIPVYRCSVCGEYDYGENPEAAEKRRWCAEINANPVAGAAINRRTV